MLGFKVEVSVYGAVSKCGIATGYVKNGLHGHNTAFVIMPKKTDKKIFNAVVVALAYNNEGKIKRVILAPEDDQIIYEPELREKLKEINGFTFEKLSCLYEKSCGAVVFNRLNGETKVLLVKNKNGRYWSFPKGHIEENENEIQTALREIKEETGLSVKMIGGFRETSEYSPFGKVKKKVVFFLAEAFTDKVEIQADEIDYSIWVDFEEAKSMCCYSNDISVLEKAEALIAASV